MLMFSANIYTKNGPGNNRESHQYGQSLDQMERLYQIREQRLTVLSMRYFLLRHYIANSLSIRQLSR